MSNMKMNLNLKESVITIEIGIFGEYSYDLKAM